MEQPAKTVRANGRIPWAPSAQDRAFTTLGPPASRKAALVPGKGLFPRAPLLAGRIGLPQDAIAPAKPTLPAAVVILSDPDSPAGASEKALSSAYRLTRAQARRREAILGCQNPAEYAETAGITAETLMPRASNLARAARASLFAPSRCSSSRSGGGDAAGSSPAKRKPSGSM